MKPVYVRTDKNGTKIYHDYTCQRCSGLGASEAWKWTGMTCYECGGSGVSKARIIREYTPEYAAKLAAKRQARWEKQQAELKAKAERLNAEFLAEYFPEGKMYFPAMSDDKGWEMIDALKAAGVKVIGNQWYFTSRPEGIPVVEATPLEITELDYNGIRMFCFDMYRIIDAKIEALKPVSQYVGTVGEKITVTAVYEHCAYYDTQFGTTWVHTFLTADGDILVWKTSNSLMAIQVDDQVTLTGTVKEHSEYRGKKQTILTRCKVSHNYQK
jgi:hypothetical protein